MRGKDLGDSLGMEKKTALQYNQKQEVVSVKTMLVTGGTVFVSRCAAAYFVKTGWKVHVLNRGNHPQPEGVTLIQSDRHMLGDCLRGRHFDAVLDVTAYTAQDVNGLLDSLDSYGQYVLISSSAVYPETECQPFSEDTPTGRNQVWGLYGMGKVAAEQALLERDPQAFILRPPYLYGPWNNVYREAFAFDCAMQNRPFYLPKDGSMKLQFLHVDDLCRFIDILLRKQLQQRVWNVGNPYSISVRDWAALCYRAAGKEPAFAEVHKNELDQRAYFSFYDYEYALDVHRQVELMSDVKPLTDGLREAFTWYQTYPGLVRRKPLIHFIDTHL